MSLRSYQRMQLASHLLATAIWVEKMEPMHVTLQDGGPLPEIFATATCGQTVCPGMLSLCSIHGEACSASPLIPGNTDSLSVICDQISVCILAASS